jgi:5-methylcytosine-specific restriction endonuclease McrA
MKYIFCDEAIKSVVANSQTLQEACRKLGIPGDGRVYQRFRKRVSELKLPLNHLCTDRRGYKPNQRRVDISNYLRENFYCSTSLLKERLFEEGLKEKRCENCLETEWLNTEIPLQLHHIDGDRKNNLLENLQILCPNCHSLTESYAGKSNRNKTYQSGEKTLRRQIEKPRPKKPRARKVVWPTVEDLKDDISKLSWVAIGKKYGVSDNAVRKWARKYGLL